MAALPEKFEDVKIEWENRRMFDLKKNIAQELAYLVVQNEITKISKLHKTIRVLYRQNGIPTFGGYIVFEKAFIFVAAKHIFQLDLSNSKLFHDLAESEKIYHGLLQDSRLFSLTPDLNERGLMRLFFLNINHAECNITSIEDLKRMNILLAKHAQATAEFKHIIRMYVGYRIMQEVIDGKIINAQEKEMEKIYLSDYFVVPAPSDEEILRTFGWRKLPVNEETLTKIFSIIQEKP